MRRRGGHRPPAFARQTIAPRAIRPGRLSVFASGKSHSSRMPGGQWPPLRRCGIVTAAARGVEDAAPYGWGGGVPGIVILSAAKNPFSRSVGCRNLPPANRIRAECRAANGRPYGGAASGRAGRRGRRPLRAVRRWDGGGQSLPMKGTGGRPTQTCSLFPVPCCLVPGVVHRGEQCSPLRAGLLPVPRSLFPVPCSLLPRPGRGASWRAMLAATGGPVACCPLPVA